MKIEPGIYVKLQSGWIRIKEKIARVTTSKRRGGGGRVVNVTYSLVGESIDGEPHGTKVVDEFYISAFKVSRYISKALDIIDKKAIMVVKPAGMETYKVIIYDGDKNIAKELRQLATDMKAIKTKIKTGVKESSS
ncbi:MAG: hypothetical protein DRO40_04545 [Thermoprotei archaeon]|nr:MAG: hypothetical protein DRO40_04545 [Thermoprotei archaeon]